MMRIAFLALLVGMAPAIADDIVDLGFDLDAALVNVMDGDGPDITEGVPGFESPIPPSSGIDASTRDACGGFDSELPVDDPCSGWYVQEYADFGDGPEPVYFNCGLDLADDRECKSDL